MSLCKLRSLFCPLENQTISLKNISHNPNQKCFLTNLSRMKIKFNFCVKSTICARKLMGVIAYSFCFIVNAWDVIKWYFRFWKISLISTYIFFVKNILTLHLNGCHSAKVPPKASKTNWICILTSSYLVQHQAPKCHITLEAINRCCVLMVCSWPTQRRADGV